MANNRSKRLCVALLLCSIACITSSKLEFDASGQIPALVSAQEMVDRSRVTAVAVNAFDCVAMCSISPKKAKTEWKPMQFVCQCDDMLAGFAGFAGDIQQAKQELQKAQNGISKQRGVSATTAQCAAALADVMMRSSTAEGRPLVVNTLLAGVDAFQAARRPVLYHVGVGGDYRPLRAAAIGTGVEEALTQLRKHSNLFGSTRDAHGSIRKRQSLAIYFALQSLLAALGESPFDNDTQNLEIAVLSAPEMKDDGDDRWDSLVRPFTSPVIAVSRPISVYRMAAGRALEALAWYRDTTSKITEEMLNVKGALLTKAPIQEFVGFSS